MPTEQDYRLEPQDGPLSKVYCRYCDREIGEVYTASQTGTGRSTGRSEEQIALDVVKIVREHLSTCDQRPARDAEAFENAVPNDPPEKGPMKTRR